MQIICENAHAYTVVFQDSTGKEHRLTQPSITQLKHRLRSALDNALFEDKEEAQRRFLKAWKVGVLLTGEKYFVVRANSVLSAIHRDQLAPRDDISSFANDLGEPEHSLLAMMLGIYNPAIALSFCRKRKRPCPGALMIDRAYTQVVAELLRWYTGW